MLQRHVVDVMEQTSSQLPGYEAPQRVEAAPAVRPAAACRGAACAAVAVRSLQPEGCCGTTEL